MTSSPGRMAVRLIGSRGMSTPGRIEIDLPHHAAHSLLLQILLNSSGLRWNKSLKLLVNSAVLRYPLSSAITLTGSSVAPNCFAAKASRLFLAYSLKLIPTEAL